MTPELIAALFATAIGTSGLAGVVAGGVQFSRRARLRKTIEQSLVLLGQLERGSSAAKSLSTAIERDTAMLAALSLVGLPTVARYYLRTAVVYFSAALVLTAIISILVREDSPRLRANPAQEPGFVWAVIGLVALSIAFAVGLMNLVRTRRDRYVQAVLEGSSHREAMLLIGDDGPIEVVVQGLTAGVVRDIGWIRSLARAILRR